MFNNLTPVSTGIIQKNSFTNDSNCLSCITFRWLSKRDVEHVDFWAREPAVDLDVSNVNKKFLNPTVFVVQATFGLGGQEPW